MSRFEKVFVNARAHERRVAADVLRHLEAITPTPGQALLDVGCGTGVALRSAVTRFGLRGVGVDIDPDQVSLARRTTWADTSVQFRIADATALPFDDEAFDIVVCRHTLHHVTRWREAVTELHRTLKSGGWMWVADIVTPRWTSSIADAFSVPRPPTADEITTVAASLGLSVWRLDAGIVHTDGVWQKPRR